VIEQPTAQAYLTMKLVSGGQTLKNAIRRWGGSGGMAVDTALRFLRQLLEPLAWMHMLHPAAVHGDLKPDNVLMTEQSDLVLTDFGLAERLPLGARGGAIQYQAPETLIGGAGGAPADIYGVGLIWYEMMTGRHPFDEVGSEALGAGDDQAFVQAHHAARKWAMRQAQPHHFSEADPRIVPSSEINKELREHPRLEAMLARCLSFRESDRYPNARLLLDDINRYVGAAPSQSAAASPVLAVVPGKPAVAATATPTKSHEARLQDVLALAAAGRTDEALSQAEKMASEQPRHVPTLLTLARSQLKAGLLEKAQLTCVTVQRLDPRNADVLDVLAEIAEAKGQHTAARALRDQANERRRAPAVRR
jgi:serine/threonine protein kinase